VNDAVTQEDINDHKYREVVTIRKQLLISNDKLGIIKSVKNFGSLFFVNHKSSLFQAI
jgi:hypothetical protein